MPRNSKKNLSKTGGKRRMAKKKPKAVSAKKTALFKAHLLERSRLKNSRDETNSRHR